MAHVRATCCPPNVLEARFISSLGIKYLVILLPLDLINVLILLPHHGLIQVES